MLRLKSIVVCFLLFFVYIISCEDIGSKCDVNTDCAGLTNTTCVNGVCACERNYTKLNGQCVRDINASCTHNSECTSPFTTCTQNKCVCQEGYVASSVNCCIPFKRLGDNCTSDYECNNGTQHSWCSQYMCHPYCEYFGTCTCQGGYYPQFGKCFRNKALGMPCSRDAECSVSSVPYVETVCKGYRCACGSGYIQRENICVNGGSRTTATILVPIILFLFSILFN